LGVNTDRASLQDLATLYRSAEPLDMRRSTGGAARQTAGRALAPRAVSVSRATRARAQANPGLRAFNL